MPFLKSRVGKHRARENSTKEIKEIKYQLSSDRADFEECDGTTL